MTSPQIREKLVETLRRDLGGFSEIKRKPNQEVALRNKDGIGPIRARPGGG